MQKQHQPNAGMGHGADGGTLMELMLLAAGSMHQCCRNHLNPELLCSTLLKLVAAKGGSQYGHGHGIGFY
jgi:hypothetical protein